MRERGGGEGGKEGERERERKKKEKKKGEPISMDNTDQLIFLYTLRPGAGWGLDVK